MILFYSDRLNRRIEYIARLIFTDILKTDIRFTDQIGEFFDCDSPKINYSPERFSNELFIKPNRFLFYKSLTKPVINPVWYNGEKYFFESSEESDIPFDPFAAAFYLVTRYEEYLESGSDRFNRYPADKSILSVYDLLKKPVVNIWARIVAGKLKEKFPEFDFPKPKFKYISTIDIDNAWSYAHKGFFRASGALLRSLLHFNFYEFFERMLVYGRIIRDPFFTYPFLDEVFDGNEENVIFFFPVGDYSKYDKNISWKNKYLQKLMRQTAKKYSVGIHPSFVSEDASGKGVLPVEISRFSKIIGKKPEKSRQHFIRLTLPNTYLRLIANDVREDYTMGYASHIGFRAGICTPYYFYDLNEDHETSFKVFPFQIMDVTLRFYLNMEPQKATEEIGNLMQEVKNAGGTFISIWHNESLTDRGKWKGYKEVFYNMNKTGFEWANE